MYFCFSKQGVTLANFMLCYQKTCAHKILPLKIMQIFAANQGKFCLVFAFWFTSCCNANVLP